MWRCTLGYHKWGKWSVKEVFVTTIVLLRWQASPHPGLEHTHTCQRCNKVERKYTD